MACFISRTAAFAILALICLWCVEVSTSIAETVKEALHDSSTWAEIYPLVEAARKGDSQAFNNLQSKAVAGDTLAQREMGWLYLQGEGVKRDEAKAFEWYQKAAENGDAQSQGQLGGFYCGGTGIRKDCAVGLKWYLKGAGNDDDESWCALANLYESGAPGVKKDYVEAYYWYSLSIDNTFCYGGRERVLKEISAEQRDAVDKRLTDYWIKRASTGEWDAQFILSDRYAKGEGVNQDYKEAYFWYGVGIIGYGHEIGNPFASHLTTGEIAAIKNRILVWKPLSQQISGAH
jgi:TPR repeat protein